MSDDDSFVILGSSPSSMQSYASITENKLLEPKSFSSVNGIVNPSPFQINGEVTVQHLESAQINTETAEASLAKSALELKYSFMNDTILPDNGNKTTLKKDVMESVVLPTMNGGPLICPDGLNASMKTSLNSTSFVSRNSNVSVIAPSAREGSLAANFLLGDVQLDVLKANVFSQFPSLNESNVKCEDIIKLQSFMAEYVEMKDTLKKNNIAMRQHFAVIQKWQDEVKGYKEDQTRQNIEFQETIAKLRNENMELKNELVMKIEQITLNEQSMRRDNDEMIKTISDKSAQIQNMTVQIEKLEQQQLNTFEFIPKKGQQFNEIENNQPEYVSILEHNRINKDFERKLSEIVAKNMELEDMKQTYIDEIDCLKVNLTSAEELLMKAQADIDVLKNNDIEKSDSFVKFQNERDELKVNMDILKTQVELYRKDFDMERTARENLAGEKEQILTDLRLLQRRNQQLIEEQQAMLAAKAESTTGTQRKFSRPNRPNTAGTSNGNRDEEDQVYSVSNFICPLCNKTFRCLDLLQIHVQECIDQ